MARNINTGVLGQGNLLEEPTTAAEPAAEPKPEAEGLPEGVLDNIDGLAQRIAECTAAAAEEKALRPQLLTAMQEANLADRTTKSGLSVKVITTNRDTFNEADFIQWAKENGHPELVKVITAEAVDMDALEKLVYGETDPDNHPLTDAVAAHTKTTTSVSLRVTAPKPKKAKEVK